MKPLEKGLYHAIGYFRQDPSLTSSAPISYSLLEEEASRKPPKWATAIIVENY